MSDQYDDYLKQLDKLYILNTSKMMKLGLEQPQALHEAIGSPADGLNIIHVAGTNGKGSVCYKLATVLQEAGYRVGLFSSPHISTYRERIRINGEMISESDVTAGLSKLFATGSPATFFEMTTLLALDYFATQKVDWVVLETGLGGRLDATNIVKPKVSAITSIGFDHCQFLGNTLEEITREKAGIIKRGVPAVIGPSVLKNCIDHDDLHQVSGPFDDYEQENRAVAAKILELLEVSYGAEIEKEPPCRFQRISHGGGDYVLDVAHNPQGLNRLFERLQLEDPTVICGLSKGKDNRASLETILKYTNNLHLVSGSHERVEEIEALTQLIPNQYVKAWETVSAAIAAIPKTSSPTVICGSFFIMEEARRTLGIVEEADVKNLQECL